MTIFTSLLVKYRGGYIEVVSAARSTLGRREGYLTFDVSTADQATALATLVLAGVAVEVFEGQVEIIPDPATAATVPGSGFQLGDRINVPTADLTSTNWKQVVGMTIGSVDENGMLAFVPELGRFNDEREAKIQRAQRRLLLGTLNGDSEAAVATRARAPSAQRHAQNPDPIVFSWAGAVAVSVSPRWYIRSPVIAKLITISLATAGTSTTTVIVYKNGSTWATLNLTTGVSKATVAVLDRLVKDDYLSMGTTAAGTGALDLSVQIDLVDESQPVTTEDLSNA